MITSGLAVSAFASHAEAVAAGYILRASCRLNCRASASRRSISSSIRRIVFADIMTDRFPSCKQQPHRQTRMASSASFAGHRHDAAREPQARSTQLRESAIVRSRQSTIANHPGTPAQGAQGGTLRSTSNRVPYCPAVGARLGAYLRSSANTGFAALISVASRAPSLSASNSANFGCMAS